MILLIAPLRPKFLLSFSFVMLSIGNQSFGNPTVALEAPRLTPFADGEWWVLTKALPFRIGVSSEIIVIPEGFTTDLASTPRFLWSVFPRTGPYMSAAILHDYLYWNQSCPKQQADEIFKIEMRSFGVDQATTGLIYAAVSEFGERAWMKNSIDRLAKVPRIIPSANLGKYLGEAFDATRTWHSLQAKVKVDKLDSIFGIIGDEMQPRSLLDSCRRAIQANQ